MLFCLSHVTRSLPSASGKAFKSSQPGERVTFTLVEHTVCFGQLPNLFLSLLCVTLCGLSFCLSVLSQNLKIEKDNFSESSCCIGGWPTPTARGLHEIRPWRMKNISFIIMLVDKLKQRQRSISFTCPFTYCGWDPQPAPHCRWPLK